LLNKQTNKQGFRARKIPESVVSGDKNSLEKERFLDGENEV
jgi:hypothetical protein